MALVEMVQDPAARSPRNLISKVRQLPVVRACVCQRCIAIPQLYFYACGETSSRCAFLTYGCIRGANPGEPANIAVLNDRFPVSFRFCFRLVCECLTICNRRGLVRPHLLRGSRKHGVMDYRVSVERNKGTHEERRQRVFLSSTPRSIKHSAPLRLSELARPPAYSTEGGHAASLAAIGAGTGWDPLSEHAPTRFATRQRDRQ